MNENTYKLNRKECPQIALSVSGQSDYDKVKLESEDFK